MLDPIPHAANQQYPGHQSKSPDNSNNNNNMVIMIMMIVINSMENIMLNMLNIE